MLKHFLLRHKNNWSLITVVIICPLVILLLTLPLSSLDKPSDLVANWLVLFIKKSTPDCFTIATIETQAMFVEQNCVSCLIAKINIEMRSFKTNPRTLLFLICLIIGPVEMTILSLPRILKIYVILKSRVGRYGQMPHFSLVKTIHVLNIKSFFLCFPVCLVMDHGRNSSMKFST